MFDNGIIKIDDAIVPKNNVGINDLVDAFYKNRSPKTIEAYQGDLTVFSVWCGMSEAKEAIQMLISLHHGAANLKVLSYKDYLVSQNLASNTVNRRIAALRSVVKLANTLGLVNWSIQVENCKTEKVRDTRGPGIGNVQMILTSLSRKTTIQGTRDYAIVRLMFNLGLRNSSVAGLQLSDYDRVQRTISVKLKGHRAKDVKDLPESCFQAIERYLLMRGNEPGFLFLNMDRSKKGAKGGITTSGVRAIIKRIGLEVGIGGLFPHKFRHEAATSALEMGIPIERVAQFLNHANTATTLIYIDNKKKYAKEVAEKIATLA